MNMALSSSELDLLIDTIGQVTDCSEPLLKILSAITAEVLPAPLREVVEQEMALKLHNLVERNEKLLALRDKLTAQRELHFGARDALRKLTAT